MRILAFILSFYVLALSLVPCCAFFGGDGSAAVTAGSAAGSGEDRDDCKNCSPFTLCGHCVGFAVTARFAKVEGVVLGSRVDWRVSDPSYYWAYHAVCWQPPRVG